MRNDPLDDFDDVPTLRAGTPDDDELLPAHVARSRRKAARPASTGPLWALLGASVIALAGLGWWSFQQISLMEQQLVATQESFARISEEAAGQPHFDLPRYVVHRLLAAGVEQVEALHLDTYADPDRFYSYRRATHLGEADYGRQLSAIALP